MCPRISRWGRAAETFLAFFLERCLLLLPLPLLPGTTLVLFFSEATEVLPPPIALLDLAGSLAA